jgi:hypothetical protein
VLRRVVKAAGRDWQLAEGATGPLIGLGVGAARLTHKQISILRPTTQVRPRLPRLRSWATTHSSTRVAHRFARWILLPKAREHTMLFKACSSAWRPCCNSVVYPFSHSSLSKCD